MKTNKRALFNSRSALSLLLVLTLLFSFVSCNLSSPDIDGTTQSSASGTTITTITPPSGTDSNKNPSGSDGGVGALDPSDLPVYSGSPFVIVNDNLPIFSESELTTVGYEKYGELDLLGRCTEALASCGKEIMPKEDEERGSISSIKPSGWVQAQYDFVSGKYLYNRCHLIGWQLSAENANKLNLITGTRYMNTEGMLPFENMVADYIRETGNHVAYRITPVYYENDLVCSGVQMEAYSIEDEGEGICFNVYCFNVQPGVSINYKTGSSTLATAQPDTDNGSDADSGENTVIYILNTSSKKIHRSDCSSVKSMSEVNKQEYTGDLEGLLDSGYEKCKNCFN